MNPIKYNLKTDYKLYKMYHSQDQYLEENIFKGHKNGFFVDVGAHDGKTINNTLF